MTFAGHPNGRDRTPAVGFGGLWNLRLRSNGVSFVSRSFKYSRTSDDIKQESHRS